jgi:uncharacterized protein
MKCPTCQKPSAKNFDPFCSSTCKNIDLLRWLKGDYRIPQAEDVSEDLNREESIEIFD